MATPQPDQEYAVNWQGIVAFTAPAFLVGGLTAYLALAFYLDRFYRELDINPTEVGFNYGSVLAASAELIVGNLALAALGAGGFLVLFRRYPDVRERLRFVPTTWSPGALFLVLILVIYGIFLIGFSLGNPTTGARFARAVKAGRPVVISPVGPFINLPLTAQPAVIAPIGKPAEAPYVAQLQNRTLIYLGQNGGIVVLYDATSHSLLRLPISSVFLQVLDCRQYASTFPACKNALRT